MRNPAQIFEEFERAFVACAMSGHTPTAFVIGHDEWTRLRFRQEADLSAFTVLEDPMAGGSHKVMDCTLLLSHQVGGITAVSDCVRHTLQATGLFEVLL